MLIKIARRHEITLYSYADDALLSIHTPAAFHPHTSCFPSTHQLLSIHTPAAFHPHTSCFPSTHQLLSIHTPAASRVTQIPRMTACIEELERWMSSTQLKLNTNKMQFMWLGSRQQVTKALIQYKTLTLGGVEIEFCTELIGLGFVFDPKLTFAAEKCFYHLQQLCTVAGHRQWTQPIL